jgi:hypothetical protein
VKEGKAYARRQEARRFWDLIFSNNSLNCASSPRI